MKLLESWIFGVAISGALVFIVIGGVVAFSPLMRTISLRNWECTDSRVVNDTLPREEECVQYTKAKP